MSLSTDSRNMRATTRRYMLGFIALLFFLQLFMVLPVGAVSANEWRAGNIIDDSVFYNKNAMSVYEIQNFLNSKVPACDTTGSGAYGNITRAQYSTGKGYPPPYICLKDYWENPTTKANNLHNGGSPGAPKPAGARSAAEIIWDVSQQYSISPKVMLVLLHKESDRLLIDNWPWAVQYKAAMGYGCPDTGANYSANCSSQYYGFYNQMSSAAKQMRRYATYPQEYRYKAGQNNTIKYAPNPECGSSTVYIENQATVRHRVEHTVTETSGNSLATGLVLFDQTVHILTRTEVIYSDYSNRTEIIISSQKTRLKFVQHLLDTDLSTME